jgi:hypothetical protein
VRALQQVRIKGEPASINLHRMIGSLVETAARNPGARGVLVTLRPNRKPVLNPMKVDRNGNVLIRPGPNLPWRRIATLDPNLVRGRIDVGDVLASLPPGALTRARTTVRPEISLGAGGELIVRGTALSDQPEIAGLVSFPGEALRPIIPVKPVLPPTKPPILPPTRPPVKPPTKPPVLPPTRPPVLPPTKPPVLPPTNTLPMPRTEAQAMIRFERTMLGVFRDQGFSKPVDEGRLQAFDLTTVSSSLISRIDPVVMVTKRVQELVKLDGASLPTGLGAELGISVTPLLDRAMAAPDLPAPTYRYLAEYDQERFCPGIGIVPPNSITLLETNPRFIESFMVGLNYEMNRELLWREFPTDQRGTPFRFFWHWLDGIPDIPPIHSWRTNTRVGSNTRGAGAGGQIVMLVRGELIRRYPNAVMLAWKAEPTGQTLKDPPAGGDIELPVFQGKLDPDIIFAGFKLSDEDLLQNGGWFFLIQEQETEPRFGLDVPTQPLGALTEWPDATWAHAGVDEGGYLNLQNADSRIKRTIDGLTFGANAAHMASITLQQPMRVAVHARFLIESP